MRYYIYGKGTNGEGVASFLELYFPNQSYAFIDDSEEKSSLANVRGHISQDDKILIASTAHYEKMAQNLEQYDLTNYTNGITWCGEVLNAKLKAYKQQYCFKKYIGLVVHKWSEQHLVDLEIRLKSAGYGVIYFVFYHDLHEKYAEKNFCLFASHAILEQVNEVEMMLSPNLMPTHPKVISIDITHGFQGSLVYPFTKFSPADEAFLKHAYSTTDYVICGSKKIHRAYEELFQSIGENTALLDTGYLKLDKDVQEYEGFCKKQQEIGVEPQNDIVIFALTYFDDIAIITTLIKECFKLNLRVFFKPHPTFAEMLMPKIAEAFVGEERLVRDIESKEELFYHSLCLVTECSSMGYTYPLTTAKPSVCLDLGKPASRVGEGRESYYDKTLMYKADKESGLVPALREILQEQESYPMKVKDYRQNECFNFGKSSQKLLEQIQIILRS